jgi:hypothetical protein
MPTLIRIKHRKDYSKGQFVAGPSGRKYHVNPSTAELHLVSRKGSAISDVSGVLPEDVEEFDSFGKIFRRVVVSAPPAPPVPKKKAAPPPPRKKADSESLASEVIGEELPDRSEKSASLADSLPNDNNYLTIREWLDLARSAGIAMSKREKALRPKSALIALIREKATDLPPKVAKD